MRSELKRLSSVAVPAKINRITMFPEDGNEVLVVNLEGVENLSKMSKLITWLERDGWKFQNAKTDGNNSIIQMVNYVQS